MKKGKITIIAGSVSILVGFMGCLPGNSQLPDQIEPEKTFPDNLVGTWKAENSKWILTFEADGNISSMTHHVGMNVNVAEGGLVEHWRNNIEATYILKVCQAEYNPDSRKLSVNISIDFRVVSVADTLEGNFDDKLRGLISNDGQTWEAIWYNYGQIEGADPIDPDRVEPKLETFHKVKKKISAVREKPL